MDRVKNVDAIDKSYKLQKLLNPFRISLGAFRNSGKIIEAMWKTCRRRTDIQEKIEVKIIDIVGDNYLGNWTNTRTACRAIVMHEGQVLLSYETKNGQWMIPGGGVEQGEEDKGCVIRETSEETGFVIKPSECVLEIDEYYEDWKWVNRYFIGTITGTCERNLTDREKEVGMEPRWLPVNEIIEVFAKHNEYADCDEMKRGMYLREYTALMEVIGNGRTKQV